MRKLLLSFLLLLSCSASFAQAKDSMQISRTIPSTFFGKDREIMISFPYGYYRRTEERYPVAYVFDAQSESLFLYTASLIQHLALTQSLEPMIVVGIKSDYRQFEFTPKNFTDEPYKRWSERAKIGGADSLLHHLESEVFPYIEQHFRTAPVRLGLGHSLGGTFVSWCLAQTARTFDAIIAVSPNYDYDKEQLVTTMKNYVLNKNMRPSFVYLARGKKDRYETLFATGIEKVVSFIREKKPANLQLNYEVLDVNNHGNTFLTGFINGLTAYHKSIYGKADNTVKHFTTLSEKYGFTLDAKQINQIAYNYFMVPGTWEQAMKIFAWGLRWYPQDVNLYDSMSEAQEHAGNKKAAMDYSLKGLAKLEELKATLDQSYYNNTKKYIEDRVARLKH